MIAQADELTAESTADSTTAPLQWATGSELIAVPLPSSPIDDAAEVVPLPAPVLATALTLVVAGVGYRRTRRYC